MKRSQPLEEALFALRYIEEEYYKDRTKGKVLLHDWCKTWEPKCPWLVKLVQIWWVSH